MADGLLFGTGTVEVKVGSANALTLGVLQNVSFSISTSQAELRGGGSKFPVKVVTTTKSVSGSAEFAKCDASVLQAILGGELSTNSVPTPNIHTIALKDKDATVEFKLTLKEPSDGTNISVCLLRCISTNFSMAFSNENFMIPNFEFIAMADASGHVMEIILPELA